LTEKDNSVFGAAASSARRVPAQMTEHKPRINFFILPSLMFDYPLTDISIKNGTLFLASSVLFFTQF
jgi:hypothetical protein